MYSYEAMMILHPALNEEEQKTVVRELESLLKESHAQLENSQAFGRRQLAYEINKQKDGIYHLMHFSSSSSAVVAKLKKACDINEKVLRVLIVKKETKR